MLVSVVLQAGGVAALVRLRHLGTASAAFEPRTGRVISFEGQAVIVSGAGRGRGRLYALDLARRGASVVVNDVGSTVDGAGADRRVADEVVEEIRDGGGIAVASYDSVDTPTGGVAIVRAALDELGRLDAVVSNAGIFHTVPFEELAVDDWQRMLRVHLDGAFHLR